jgi:methyl-accepting chemotaxis protein
MTWTNQTFKLGDAMNNLKIGTRLGFGFSLILLLLTAMTVIGILRLSSASALTDEMINVKIRDERLTAEWGKIIEVNAARTTGAWMVADPADQKKLEAMMAESSGRATQIQDQIGASIDNDELKPLFKQVLDTRKAYTEFRKAVFAAKNAGGVADGDLTSDIAVDSRDEAGQMMEALRHMNDSLIRIVGEVRSSTESMSGVSGEIASRQPRSVEPHRSPGQFPGHKPRARCAN